MDIFTSPYFDACSPIGTASRSGDAAKLEGLLQKGEDYTIKDNRGWYPMHEAAFSGHILCVKLLLQAAQRDCETTSEIREFVFPAAFDGSTPLSLATMGGHYDIVQLLAPFYSDVHIGSCGFPIHIASERSDLSSLQILVQYTPHLINSRNSLTGQYPLHVAVEKQSISVVNYLLQHEAKVDVQDSDYGMTPLHAALYNGNEEIVNLLLNAGCDVHQADDANCTALYIAAQSGNSDLVERLLDHGADPSIAMPLKNKFVTHSFPLTAASQNGHVAVVKKLAKVTPRTYETSSAIVFAAIKGKTESLRILFNEGFPTFRSTYDDNVDTPWDLILTENVSNLLEAVQILINNSTCFCELARAPRKILFQESLFSVTMDTCSVDVLKVFLNAGLMEMRFECNHHPDTSGFANEYEKINEILSRTVDPMRLQDTTYFTRFALCMKYYPFAKLLEKCDDHVPGLMHKKISPSVPSLVSSSRWILRCILVENHGLVNETIVRKLKLPSIISDFLLYR